MNTLQSAIVASLITVILAHIAMFVHVSIGRIAEVLIGPGAFLPILYWGALHDPLQWLAEIILNIFFYTPVFYVAFALWKRRPRGTKSVPR